MLKILKYLSKKEWLLALTAVLFIVCQVWLDLTMPDYMSAITRLVQTAGSEMSDILYNGGMMLLCALGSLVAAFLTSVCAARIGSNLSANLRGRIFNKVQSFSMAEIGRFSTASLITRSTNDITQVQMLITMGLQMLIKAPLTAAYAICKIAGKNWIWTMSTGAAVAVLLVIVGICIVIALPKFKKVQQLTDNLNRVTRENLNGMRVVRAYNAEGYQEAKFSKANEELTNTQLFTQHTMALLMPSVQMVMNALSLSIYWIGAVLINSAGMVDKITLFSDMVVFSSYAMQVVMAFMMLVMIFMILPRASVAASRVNEVLDTEVSVSDGEGAAPDPDCCGLVEFKNVSFRYPDAEEYVLHNVSFTAKKGETVAFIGATGCGKSTIINMVPRFYDATEGAVLVDGVNVKNYTQTQLRNKIGYVSQRAILFTGTVRSNVAFGDNGRHNLNAFVEDAVATAQAAEFVEKLEDGYDGFVAPGGTNLSGGQRQRLSIARAVCRQPEILIFDDSFSALDYKTDKILRRALDEQCGETTRLIVAQRIGTIRDADQIIVLDEGRIAGKGTHEELMQTCEVYRQIAYSQLSEDELRGASTKSSRPDRTAHSPEEGLA